MNIELGPDNTFLLTLPNGHSVAVPQSDRGLSILRRILSAEAASGPAKIGHAQAPVQHMVDEWLKAEAAAKQSEALALAKSLNINFEL